MQRWERACDCMCVCVCVCVQLHVYVFASIVAGDVLLSSLASEVFLKF